MSTSPPGGQPPASPLPAGADYPTNQDRVGWAAAAIDAFQSRTRTDDESVLSDLLCDLRHWADERGIDFDAALNRADLHYSAEADLPDDD